MSNTTKNAFKIVEKELIKFSSYENVKSILSKYMIGGYDKELVEKLLVILSTEFRHNIERMSTNLPEDDTEAAAIVNKRATSTRGRKAKVDDLKIEVVDNFEFDD
jgi:hypothetical protein